MLGLNLNEERIYSSMIATTDTLTGYEITASVGMFEGVSERSLPAVAVGGVGFHSSVDIKELVEAAKDWLCEEAIRFGANAVVGFRYEIFGRDLEKGVVAYGTAVKCRKITAG